MTTASFEELARLPDEQIDVALGAALVARDTYDALDVTSVLATLDDLAGHPPVERASDLRACVASVSERFQSQGFHGNTEDYYDPRNSLLPDVLSRRTGIPITLSIVWCAMAERAGLRARGVAFPGHFLVRVDERDNAEEPGALVDPFHGGRLVDEQAATVLLRRALGAGSALHPAMFTAATPRAILVRLLTNLQATYGRRGDNARAFLAVSRILTLVPDASRVLRERASLAMQMGAFEVARADLSRVLALEPDAGDAPSIAARLATLAAQGRPLN